MSVQQYPDFTFGFYAIAITNRWELTKYLNPSVYTLYDPCRR